MLPEPGGMSLRSIEQQFPQAKRLPGSGPFPIVKGRHRLGLPYSSGSATNPTSAPAAIHISTDMSIRNPLLFDDGLNPSRGTATTQYPEALFRKGLDGLTQAAFESALGFYGMNEQGFFRSMIDQLIHHHQNLAELEWPLDFAVKHSVSFGLEQ